MKRGFTLVEMMVAVSIFSIVVVIVGGALITTSAINRQAQATKLVVDNLNFAVDSLVLSLRDGKFFQCNNRLEDNYNFGSYHGDGSEINCPTGGDGIVFERRRRGVTQNVAYRFNDVEKNIQYASNPPGPGTANFIDMTSAEVEITDLTFRVIDAVPAAGGNSLNPRLLVTVSGKTKDKTQTKFYLQTSVSALQ